MQYLKIFWRSWPKLKNGRISNRSAFVPLFAHARYIVPATIGHGSLIIRIVAYYSGDQSLKIQGLIGIVALQGASAPLLILHNYTVFMQMHDF
jgi:hypothetical protein